MNWSRVPDHPRIHKRVLGASRRLIIRDVAGGPQTASSGGHMTVLAISLTHTHTHTHTRSFIHTWQRFKPRSVSRRHPLASRLFCQARALIGPRATKRFCLLVGSFRRETSDERKRSAFRRQRSRVYAFVYRCTYDGNMCATKSSSCVVTSLRLINRKTHTLPPRCVKRNRRTAFMTCLLLDFERMILIFESKLLPEAEMKSKPLHLGLSTFKSEPRG